MSTKERISVLFELAKSDISNDEKTKIYDKIIEPSLKNGSGIELGDGWDTACKVGNLIAEIREIKLPEWDEIK